MTLRRAPNASCGGGCYSVEPIFHVIVAGDAPGDATYDAIYDAIYCEASCACGCCRGESGFFPDGWVSPGPCYQRLSRDRFGAGLYWQPLGRGPGRGLARVNPETGRILTRVPIPSRTIESLAQDRVGRIWIGTFDGLVRVDPRTDEITAQTF